MERNKLRQEMLESEIPEIYQSLVDNIIEQQKKLDELMNQIEKFESENFKIINDKTITKQKSYTINALLILLVIFVLLGIIFTYNKNETKTKSCAEDYNDSCRVDSAATEFKLLKHKNYSMFNDLEDIS